MSRCSPFPPLGYVWKGVCGEALVELMIKVKREWTAAAETRKKERRQRKKEKRREKRKIKKKKQSSDQRHWVHWNTNNRKRSDHQEESECEPQMLENFSLVEKLEQHILSGGIVRLWYNSEDVNRQKPCSFPCDCHKLRGDGNIIWAEFLPKEHTDPRVQCTPNGVETFGMDTKPSWMPCHSAYKRGINEEASETVPITSIAENDLLEIESQFRELIDNWVPDPQLSEHTEFDDQEWLFETSSVQRNTTERSTPICKDSHHGSSTLYPHGRYLPEADLIALPFTIIF